MPANNVRVNKFRGVGENTEGHDTDLHCVSGRKTSRSRMYYVGYKKKSSLDLVAAAIRKFEPKRTKSLDHLLNLLKIQCSTRS